MGQGKASSICDCIAACHIYVSKCEGRRDSDEEKFTARSDNYIVIRI
jgi:hypothetical protein